MTILNEFMDVSALSQQRHTRPIETQLAYATTQNFAGRIINGYTAEASDFTLMTRASALALCHAQEELVKEHNLGLRIYDAYRPKRAVLDFMAWMQMPCSGEIELARKAIHYPNIQKTQFFDLHYLSADSQHCYGHAVDVVLIDAEGRELDHGACFDYLDPLAHLSCTEHDIGVEAYENRRLLTRIMEKHGFKPYEREFWHFSFRQKALHEPLDIVITANLKGLNVPVCTP